MGSHRSEAGIQNGLGLGLAGGEEQHFVGRHDIGDAHGVCVFRNFIDGGEEAGVGLDGALSQGYAVGIADELFAGLVEADVSVAADAQKLQVNAAHGADQGIVLAAGLVRVRLQPLGTWVRLLSIFTWSKRLWFMK